MTDNEGWIKFPNSTKFHYIGADGRSLCGKWILFRTDAPLEPDDSESPDDCKECRRKLTKRAALAARGE